MSERNHRILEAEKYSKHGLQDTHFLAFKYIPALIKKHVHGVKTLDYGCGAGRSTRFLKELGLAVDGVDIDEKMIREALKFDDSLSYEAIKTAHLAMPSKTYDFVFSSLVMLKIPSKKELADIFNEIYRVLKDDGIFIFVTSSTKMYNHKWLSLGTDYEENEDLKSGALAKVLLKDINLEIRDYFWTSSDYKEIIAQSGFLLKEKLYPLGDASDGFSWLSETALSPYVVYVLEKAQQSTN